MPAQRRSMRQVREVLRLKHVAGHSERSIAAAIGISRYTVAEYPRRATVVGITRPAPAELDDSALEARLFSPPFAVHESPRPQPGLAAAACRVALPQASPCCCYGRGIAPGSRMDTTTAGSATSIGIGALASLRQCARPMSPANGCSSIRRSNRTDHRSTHRRSAANTDLRRRTRRIELCVCRSTRGLADWIGCHVNALTFFGGVTRQIVSDNFQALATAGAATSRGSIAPIRRWHSTTAPPFAPLAVRSAIPAGFVGITGWLPLEQVAGFNRNCWLFSSESASKAL